MHPPAPRPTLADLGDHLPGGDVIELPVELDSPLEHLERYTVLRLIGAGGMGKIYQAWDALLERHVALKVMRPEVPQKEQRRFRREALLGARLLHPGLVRVYDMGVDAAGMVSARTTARSRDSNRAAAIRSATPTPENVSDSDTSLGSDRTVT